MIRDFRTIENRDAVLAYDRVEYARDAKGEVQTRWDGRTLKASPVTGDPIPDDSARVPIEVYVNPRKAAWPDADFVVGNPPFIGSKRMRDVLGDGYVDALQQAWPEVPQATDLVMRWWHAAAQLTAAGSLKRFGLITTNSISQAYVRRAVEPHLSGAAPISIVYAVPDHPWVDASDGASVRIAMTVGEAGSHDGLLVRVTKERRENAEGEDDRVLENSSSFGRIHSDLRVGVDVTRARPLLANLNLCSVGMKTIGAGFLIEKPTAISFGLGAERGTPKAIKPYVNGRDLATTARSLYVIDLFGLEEQEVREQFPEVYQHLLVRVKPEREQNRNPIFRQKWWVIGHPRPQFRNATADLSRTLQQSRLQGIDSSFSFQASHRRTAR